MTGGSEVWWTDADAVVMVFRLRSGGDVWWWWCLFLVVGGRLYTIWVEFPLQTNVAARVLLFGFVFLESCLCGCLFFGEAF